MLELPRPRNERSGLPDRPLREVYGGWARSVGDVGPLGPPFESGCRELADGESGPLDSFVLLFPILCTYDPHVPDQLGIESRAGQRTSSRRQPGCGVDEKKGRRGVDEVDEIYAGLGKRGEDCGTVADVLDGSAGLGKLELAFATEVPCRAVGSHELIQIKTRREYLRTVFHAGRYTATRSISCRPSDKKSSGRDVRPSEVRRVVVNGCVMEN